MANTPLTLDQRIRIATLRVKCLEVASMEKRMRAIDDPVEAIAARNFAWAMETDLPETPAEVAGLGRSEDASPDIETPPADAPAEATETTDTSAAQPVSAPTPAVPAKAQKGPAATARR